MRAWSLAARGAGAVLISIAMAAAASAQTAAGPPPAAAVLTMADAVRLALEHNHQIKAQRLNVDASKADQVTAALKPNPVFSSLNQNFPVFSPSQLTWHNAADNQTYAQSLSYLFERGGKRLKRAIVAEDTTDVTTKAVMDAERQLTFQTAQAFISVLLAKSTFEFATEDLKNFNQVVELNRERMAAGSLAEADFYRISLQKLQFEQDVSAAQVALVQARAALRADVGYDSVPESFDVAGELAYRKYASTLDDLKQAALAARPDLLAAQSGMKLAEDAHALQLGNRTRDLTGEVEYDHANTQNALGFGFSIELPFHDRNQGNIARAKVAVQQAAESSEAARVAVMTDVVSAWAAYQTSEKVVSLFQSGYLDQATQSLEISTYVFQRGSGTLLDLLDAERTYRSTELAFRQALAAYMTSIEQLNFVVGKQVMQ